MKFGAQAECYERHASVQKVASDWLAEWLESDVRGLSALELGAGTGLFTSRLVDLGFRSVEATDISLEMIRVGALRVPSANWSLLDAWSPTHRTCDRLYSCSLMQWCEDPVLVLKKWRQIVPVGGRALLSFFLEGSLREFLGADERFSVLQWRNEDEWLTAFQGGGWEVRRSDTRTDVEYYANSLSALRGMHQIGAVGRSRFTGAGLKRALGRCDEKYLEKAGLPLTWRIMRVELIAR